MQNLHIIHDFYNPGWTYVQELYECLFPWLILLAWSLAFWKKLTSNNCNVPWALHDLFMVCMVQWAQALVCFVVYNMWCGIYMLWQELPSWSLMCARAKHMIDGSDVFQQSPIFSFFQVIVCIVIFLRVRVFVCLYIYIYSVCATQSHTHRLSIVSEQSWYSATCAAFVTNSPSGLTATAISSSNR